MFDYLPLNFHCSPIEKDYKDYKEEILSFDIGKSSSKQAKYILTWNFELEMLNLIC